MATPEHAELRIGDIVSFGTPHPRLIFDKRCHVPLVDGKLRVPEVMPTFF